MCVGMGTDAVVVCPGCQAVWEGGRVPAQRMRPSRDHAGGRAESGPRGTADGQTDGQDAWQESAPRPGRIDKLRWTFPYNARRGDCALAFERT